MRHGVYATFMPKPLSNENGSGMHIQLSLFRGEENAFADDDAEYGLSSVGKQYMAGLLRHAPELALVTNQWVNSYRRLVPGFEAPTYVTWSSRNQADLLRVPRHRPGERVATRIEYRAPDAACNPYLVFASMLAAGLAGVEGDYPLPPPVERDMAELSPAEAATRGLTLLPTSLGEAIAHFDGSQLMRATLGAHVVDSLVTNKRHEWAEYRAQVSAFEIERYLSTL